MKVTLTGGMWNKVFAVPAELIDKYIAKVSGDYIKVILFVLKADNSTIETSEISKHLKLDAACVNEALAFWCGAGFISNSNEQFENEAVVEQKPNLKIVSEKPPVIPISEIAQKINSNPEISFLMTSAEMLFGGPLSSAEQRVIISCYEWLGLEIDVILILLEYCITVDKKSARYIEKTAVSWVDEGIDTNEKAESMLKKLTKAHTNEALVVSCFGINNRNLTPKEKEYINCWFNEWGFDIAMVKLAFEKTADQLSKISFPYINKILESWQQNNIKTPKQVIEQESTPKKRRNGKNTSYNIEELEKIGYNIPND